MPPHSFHTFDMRRSTPGKQAGWTPNGRRLMPLECLHTRFTYVSHTFHIRYAQINPGGNGLAGCQLDVV
eukprot:363725-Chlamydomonas_euryale.AAC.2